MSTLARRFRQIIRVRSKSDIFENYMDKSSILCLLNFVCNGMVYEIKICFFGSTTCLPVRLSVVTQHLMSSDEVNVVYSAEKS